MDDNGNFKRLHYFTGLFTTADDWIEEQEYHITKRRHHGRGLHMPGVIRDQGDDLKVVIRDQKLRVYPGAVLDRLGRYIHVARAMVSSEIHEGILAIRYHEAKEDRFINVENPDYTGFRRWVDRPEIKIISEEELRNSEKAWVELARITLEEDGTFKTDRRRVKWAGSVGRYLSPELQSLFDSVMIDTRQAFGMLADRFPNRPSEETRQLALALRVVNELETLGLHKIPAMIKILGEIEFEVLLALKPQLEGFLSDYQKAVEALRDGQDVLELLDLQRKVARAAEALAKLPIASAGVDQTAVTSEDVASVPLDASDSHAFADEITAYHWDKK